MTCSWPDDRCCSRVPVALLTGFSVAVLHGISSADPEHAEHPLLITQVLLFWILYITCVQPWCQL